MKYLTNRICARLILVLLLGSAASMSAADWPTWRGKAGDGVSESGQKLVEDLAKAKLLWRSEADTPGSYTHRPHGGHSSPIVMDGRVYLYYPDPSGPVIAEDYFRKAMGSAKLKAMGDTFWRKQAAIAADDVIICMDADTGRTLWRQAFEGEAVNMGINARGPGPSSKVGPYNMICGGDGRVYALGALGLVYAVDAETGEPLWRTPLPGYEANKRKQEEALQRGRPYPVGSRGINLQCVTYAGGTVVVPRGGTLYGLAGANGEILWKIQKAGGERMGPIAWPAAAGARVLAPYRGGVVCVDAKAGKELWRQAMTTADGKSLVSAIAAAGDFMITKGGAGPRGWRINDSGAVPAWKLDDKYRTGSGAVAPVIYRGHAYVQYGASGGGGSQGLTKCRGILCVELATGKIVSDCRFANDGKLIPESLRGVVNVGRPLYSSMVAGDGILLIEGSAYGNGLVGFTTSPSDFRCIGAIDGATVGGEIGGFAFASCITPALANGRLYVRGHPGMYCIDLRAAAKSRSPQVNRDEDGRAAAKP